MAYVCLLNGLANIFINNFINVSLNRFKHIGQKKRKTFVRQFFGDLLFFLQNLIFVICGLMVNIKPLNEAKTATILTCAIFACHFAGIILKIVYYKQFHIWKDITVTLSKNGLKRGHEKTHLIQCNPGIKADRVETKA